MHTHYQTLGISEAAGHGEIKAAFKKLAMKYHPDKHAGDPVMEELFKEVNAAYQVLSDPVRKADYDYRLRYSGPSFEAPPHSPVYPPPRPPFARPHPTSFSRDDLRQNNKATAWAFALALGFGVVAMLAVQVYNYYEHLKLQATLSERRMIFSEAVQEAEKGHVQECLHILSAFTGFYKEEEDIRIYKQTLIEKNLSDADDYFQKGDYGKALTHYETVYPFMNYRTFKFIYQMTLCYRYTREYIKALEMYEKLLDTGEQKKLVLSDIATLYRDDLGNFEKSLYYFQQAANTVIEDYISTFGEAYLILLNDSNVPREDLDIFMNEARGYLLVGNLNQSLHETKWLANVWPGENSIFLLRAECYRQAGNEAVACQYINLAARLGPLPKGVQQCQ